MREFELEEGEAYFLQGDDDDENIDPDRDFSYIDKKIENVLGQYQKDFMGGLSAETLGARFGGYGSFLPMQERSTPILSNPASQSHICLKSPQNPLLERSHQNPSSAANISLPARPGLFPSVHSMQASSELGVNLVNKQLKLQSSGEGSSSDQQKKPVIHHAVQSSLKFRVKMTSENVSSRDNSAIYSGLGLDMSPCSSPDDIPEFERTSPGTQEKTEESPSFIVKIMTSSPLFNDALLSPLDVRWISFMAMGNNLESDLPGSTQELPFNSIYGSTYSEAKRETGKEKKSKSDNTNKDKKSKQTDSSKDGKSKQKVHMKGGEFVKEFQDYPPNAVSGSANRREVGELSAPKAVVSKSSVNSADTHCEVKDFAALTGSSNGSKASNMFSEKNEIGHFEKPSNKSLKQEMRAKAKSEGEFVLVPSNDVGMGGEGNMNTLRGKIEKDKKVSSNPRNDSSDRRKEAGPREGEANKVLKQLTVANKEKVKEEFLSSVSSKEDDVDKKVTVTKEKFPKDMEVGFDVEENDEQFSISQERKARNMETIEPSKQKSHSKAISNSQTGAGLSGGKERSSAVAKKKPKESHADVVSASEPPRENVMSVSAADNDAMFRSNAPYKIKKGDMDLLNQNRKDIDSDTNAYLGRKVKEANSKDSAIGVSEKEMRASVRKMKEKSSSKKTLFASNIGSNMEGDLAGEITTMEKVPGLSAISAENALVMDDWVMCEKCGKWRLLPFGRDPVMLPKKWLCKMLDWLPGMNKCTVSEEETTNALYAMYQLQVPASLVQNYQQAYPGGSAPVATSASAQPFTLPIQAANSDAMPGGGNNFSLVKTEASAAKKSGFQVSDISVKRDLLLDESTNSKNMQKYPRESDAVPKNGDGMLSKNARKRVSSFEASGVSKKMKRESMENPDPVGMLTIEAKGEVQNYNPDALQISENFTKGYPESPLMKAKERTQKAMVARVDEKKDVSGRKRKLKDQQKNFVLTEEFSVIGSAGKSSDSEHRKYKKEKKLKPSNSQAREGTTDQVNGRAHSDVGKHNFSAGCDIPLEKHNADKLSQRAIEKPSEKAHDLVLDNATTSSSSKISRKVKTKAHEVKCSPVGSISSSPMRVSKSDPDKRKNKTSIPYDEPEKLSSAKRLKSRAEGASIEFAPHNKEMRVRKSNLSKTSGIMFDASDDDHSAKKISSGRRPTTHKVDTHPKLENRASGRLDLSYEEGTSTSPQNIVSEHKDSRSLNVSHFAEINSQRGKTHVSGTSVKKELPWHSHSLPKLEEGSGPSAMIVDKVSLRHHQPSRHVSRDTGASSSIVDSFCKNAKTALKEATDLKHSANRMKKSGSGLGSTVVFFQAALRFLHGGYLLELDYSESGRCGEMSPSDVYNSTAKLCEYCAREYERSNDMASVALVYKCMEVAYMRLVYHNDLAASRDRLELQMAARASAQAESPSSSASDIDNLNNQAAMDPAKDGDMVIEHRNHVISAGHRPNFIRLLDFTKYINLAMEASRKSQSAFAAANLLLTQAGNEEGMSCIKRVIDFSFHDVDGLLHLIRLAMETLN